MGMHGGNLKEAQERYRLKKEEIIDFSANINPLGFPGSTGKIISSHLDDIAHYPDPDCKDLKEALTRRLNTNADNLLIGNGSMELIFLLALALKPKKALIPSPAFTEYERGVRLSGGRCLFLKTREDNNFEIKVAEITRHLSSVDSVFICNPNNPTGFLFDREKIRFLAQRCEKKGVLLVIDEVFMDFVEKKGELSMASLAPAKRHLLVLHSLTKFFAFAGLRLGYLIGNKKLLKGIACYQPPWSVNALAQLVGCAAVKDTLYFRKSREYVFRERDVLCRELREIRFLKTYPATANFIFCKLKSQKMSSRKLCDYCASRGILIRDCSNFRGLDNRFIRLAVRKREENRKLINILREAIPT